MTKDNVLDMILDCAKLLEEQPVPETRMMAVPSYLFISDEDLNKIHLNESRNCINQEQYRRLNLDYWKIKQAKRMWAKFGGNS